jgi:putative oxidoreductase
MIPLLAIFSDWTLLLLRLVYGWIFLAHGWPKLKNLKINSKNFEMMGFRPGSVWGTIVALAETFGGLAIILRLGTQYAGLILAFNMLVAASWKVKRGQKLIGGFELDIALLAIGLILAGFGGGLYSLDSYLSL